MPVRQIQPPPNPYPPLQAERAKELRAPKRTEVAPPRRGNRTNESPSTNPFSPLPKDRERRELIRKNESERVQERRQTEEKQKARSRPEENKAREKPRQVIEHDRVDVRA